jgi:hypothetical protein
LISFHVTFLAPDKGVAEHHICRSDLANYLKRFLVPTTVPGKAKVQLRSKGKDKRQIASLTIPIFAKSGSFAISVPPNSQSTDPPVPPLNKRSECHHLLYTKIQYTWVNLPPIYCCVSTSLL